MLVLATCCLAQLLHVIRETYSSDGAESMLRLACKVFGCDMACCTLLTGDAYHVLAGAGILRPGICPDRWGFCAWSFLNSNHELVVVEDTKNDIRSGVTCLLRMIISQHLLVAWYCPEQMTCMHEPFAATCILVLIRVCTSYTKNAESIK